MGSRLRSMAAWNVVSWIALAVLGFLTTSIIYRIVGPASYGVWATIASLRVFTSVFDSGLTLSIARDTALNAPESADSRARAGTSTTLTVSIGLLVVAAGVVFSGLPRALLGLSGDAAAEAQAVMVIVGCDAGIAIASTVVFATARGRERFDLLAASAIVQVIVAVPLLLVLTDRFGLIGAALALVVARIAAVGVAGAWLVKGERHRLRLAFHQRAVSDIVAFVWPLWIVSVGTIIGLGTDVLIVGAYFGSVPAGAYALGAVVPAAGVGLLYALLDAAYPRLASSRGRDEGLVSTLIQIGTMLASLGFGVMIAIAPEILAVWVGAVDPLAIQVMRVYAIVWILNVPAHVLVLRSISSSTHRILAPLVIGESLVSLAISIWLASIGFELGPAIGTLVTLAGSNLVLVPWFLTRTDPTVRRPMAKSAAIGALLGSLAAILIAGVVAILGARSLEAVMVATPLVLVATVVLLQTAREEGERGRWWRILVNGGLGVRWRQRGEVASARAAIELAREVTPVVWIRSAAPLVTVRIATYNRGDLVRDRAIASALAQTHSNLEIVVVGDHCDAATEAAVRSVTDPRLRFENLAERGRYPADPRQRWMVAGTTPMNRGVDLARGTWLAPLDDDDEFTVDHIEALLDACRSRELELVYGVADMEISPGHWEPVGSAPLRRGQIIHSAVLYSARLRMIQHDIESWRLEEAGDWNLWHRMRDAGARIGFLDHVVTRHHLEQRELWSSGAIGPKRGN